MNEARWERWGAASGYAVLLVGAAAVAFERGWPNLWDPIAVADFVAVNRGAIRVQSLLFLIGAGIFLWFLGSLRSFLMRAEGGTGRLATLAFGAGIAWVGISAVAQAFQAGLATAAPATVDPGLLWTMTTVFVVANVPMAVLLVAVAVVSFRSKAFRAWLGWLSAVACINAFYLIDAAGGTGGGLFRYMYGRFLEEAAAITGAPALRGLGVELHAIGDRWQDVAELLQKAAQGPAPPSRSPRPARRWKRSPGARRPYGGACSAAALDELAAPPAQGDR